MKKTEIECVHVKLPAYRKRSLYIYELLDGQTLYLCPDCNMMLAGKVMEQLAIEVFVDKPEWNNNKSYELIKREESKICQKKKKIRKKKK